MTPQDDAYPEVIEAALRALIDRDWEAGRRVLEPIAYPVHQLRRRPAVPRPLMARIYKRDHFLCRYCGGRSILTVVMELLGGIYPEVFPFHPNWKGGLTHPAVITRSAVIDHVQPGTRGGPWLAESNLVTACWPCNARKADLTLAELGWSVRPVEDSTWDGLTGLYSALWRRCSEVWRHADRPDERLHLDWMRCLGLPVPD